MRAQQSLKHEDSITLAFRISREDAARVQLLSDLSGMMRQDYIRERVLDREVTVYPNIRVRKYLEQYLIEVRDELKKVSGKPAAELLQKLDDILNTVEKL